MTVLGISTNTRLLGLAIITKNGLAKYQVHLHKSSWSPSKANLIISSLEPCVRQYCIKKVVLSIPPKHHQTEAFLVLLQSLKAYFNRKHIEAYEVESQRLYELCSNDAKQTKQAVMKALVGRFPQLKRYYEREVRKQHRYYTKLFEAVGVALLYREQ